MCGIAGIVDKEINAATIRQMIKDIARRGPDDSGVLYGKSGNVALCQTRLSIIDLTSSGHQPMISKDGRYIIVFNGEIYNYKEIRKHLIARGATFTTNSDTEVILLGWILLGELLLPLLRGMFAFGIWDNEVEKLVLVRDRLGIKPLLFSENNGKLYFASTLGCLLGSGFINPILDYQSLFDYLATGSVLQPRTMIRGVQALMPGTILEYQNKTASFKSYWDIGSLDNINPDLKHINFTEQVQMTRDLLEEACKFHLVSDVPVGSFLSGGVDSTTITALMARLSNKKVSTYSIGFTGDKVYSSEVSDAKIIADYIGTEHHELQLSGIDVANNFTDFVSVIDQPSIDGLNTYWASKFARNNVKVALSGLGGDEIFAGYPHFSWYRLNDRRADWLKKICANLYRIFPFAIAKTFYEASLTMDERFENLRRMLNDKDIVKCTSHDISKSFSNGHVARYIESIGCNNASTVRDISLYECKNYLVNTLLRDSDVTSMGNGLELRPIFLDHKIVEFALALPDNAKLNSNVGKYILKAAAKDLLPEDFFKRKKTGFTLPISNWMKEAPMEQRFIGAAKSSCAQEFFSRDYLNFLIDNPNNRKIGWVRYQILVFLEWAEMYKVSIN